MTYCLNIFQHPLLYCAVSEFYTVSEWFPSSLITGHRVMVSVSLFAWTLQSLCKVWNLNVLNVKTCENHASVNMLADKVDISLDSAILLYDPAPSPNSTLTSVHTLPLILSLSSKTEWKLSGQFKLSRFPKNVLTHWLKAQCHISKNIHTLFLIWHWWKIKK